VISLGRAWPGGHRTGICGYNESPFDRARDGLLMLSDYQIIKAAATGQIRVVWRRFVVSVGG
jgi:hypothetical protein